MPITNTRQRFGWVAVTLHWLIAISILYMIWLGYSMTRDEDYAAYQTHKSLGITILALSLLRLVWRLFNPPPPLPEGTPWWERWAAHLTHWAFYGLMIGIPLVGWLYISASPTSDFVTTQFWDLFELPPLGGLETNPDREAIADRLEDVHAWLAYGTLALLALHVGAALKHHFWNRDDVLHRMAPLVPNPEKNA